MSLAPDDPDVADVTASDVPALDVYWRPGCGYCTRLFRALRSAQVTIRTRNIWEDPAARQFVRTHNEGNETVPTVTLAGVTMTNPDPKALVADIRADYPHLLGEPAPSWNPLHRLGGRG
jgi:glutaredoxin